MQHHPNSRQPPNGTSRKSALRRKSTALPTNGQDVKLYAMSSNARTIRYLMIQVCPALIFFLIISGEYKLLMALISPVPSLVSWLLRLL